MINNYYKRNILPSKEQVYYILFYCINLCVYLYVFFYINNTAKSNPSLMLNKLLILLPLYIIKKLSLLIDFIKILILSEIQITHNVNTLFTDE